MKFEAEPLDTFFRYEMPTRHFVEPQEQTLLIRSTANTLPEKAFLSCLMSCNPKDFLQARKNKTIFPAAKLNT
ncbi:predicted protein [Methanosarcina acetivorans C2A]|uniref:Uncharacterized protein n=1 Tax=Methanosarcina acetivorans (strain ATCC 35395 / DSM 2834 / JCM 12185 / C2A) TaxID=188937 RepID=Q8TK97_METAC|nr:predicted protein [Methanosarcina acetivorans C2A]